MTKLWIDNIVNGNILGVCLFAGCNDAKVVQDLNFVELVKELVKENVLILCTGCASGSFARHGLLTPAATEKYAGPGLKAVLTALGHAAGLNAPLPMALHTGSCVDNTRAASIATALANKLGVDVYAPTDKIVYPPGARAVVDVTKPPYRLDPTGKRDCTAALNRLIDDILRPELEGMKAIAERLRADPRPEARIGFESRKLAGGALSASWVSSSTASGSSRRPRTTLTRKACSERSARCVSTWKTVRSRTPWSD